MAPLNLDVWSALLILGIGQGFILFIVILAKTTGPSKLFLGGLLLILSFSLLEFLLLSSNYYSAFPHLVNTSQPFLFLLGPLVFFYVRSQLFGRSDLGGKSFLHLVPFILASLRYLPWYLESAEVKTSMIEQSLTPEPSGVGLAGFSFALSHISIMLIYLLMTIRTIKKYKKRQNQLSKGQLRQVSFLQTFCGSFLTYWILQLLGLVLITVFQLYVYQIDYVLALLNSLFIQVLGIYVLLRPTTLFTPSSGKYEQSSLTANQSDQLLTEIMRLMNAEIFLNPDLTLESISTELNTNKNYISQVINQEFGVNFSELVNGYRISKAKELMEDPKTSHLKLLAIALEAGFNNKTSFTRVFRRYEGTTPSAYRNSIEKKTVTL